MPGRQGGQHIGVHDDQPGLPEGAHDVFGVFKVDGGFAADGGIDLGQRGGGQVDEVDAPHIAGRRKAGQISHHAAAHGHYGVAAAEALFQHGVQQLPPYLQAFAVLALGHRDDIGMGALGGRLLHILHRHTAVGDHQHLAVQMDQLVHPSQAAPLYNNVIAAHAQLHGQFHCCSSFEKTPSSLTLRHTPFSCSSSPRAFCWLASPTSST